MSVEVANIEQMMAWFADGGRVRSEHAEADQLVERLAALIFDGERDWPERTGQAVVYRDSLRGWLNGDAAAESELVQLTSTDSDPGLFLNWLARTLARREAADAQQDEAVTGFPNPQSDGTPGTEYYRLDEATGEYLYAATADSPNWAGYEQRRYGAETWNVDYELYSRYDRRDQAYEWYDKAAQAWQDQSWANAHHAARQAGASDDMAQATPPVWDASWQMFYRLTADGQYEYAHARTPGVEASGCGEEWLTQAEAEQSRTEPAVDPAELTAGAGDLHSDLLAAAGAVLPDLAVTLSDEDIRAVFEEVAGEVIRGS